METPKTKFAGKIGRAMARIRYSVTERERQFWREDLSLWRTMASYEAHSRSRV